MSKCSEDFERFLYANYPDDYRRATAEDVPDDVLTAILSRHETHYKIWEYVPEWVKDRYSDVLPREVLDGNVAADDFVDAEEEKLNEEEKESRALINYSVSLLALGYAAETVAEMAANRELRMQLLKEAGNQPFSPEQKARWLALREKDRQIIEKEWREHQPEKYIIHLAKTADRAYRKAQNGGSLSGMTLDEADNEIRKTMSRIMNREEKMRLVDYLRQRPQQAALKHLSPEMQNRLVNIFRENGINMTPVKDREEPSPEINRDSLEQSLKNSFERCKKMEDILSERYQKRNIPFERASAVDVADEQKDSDIQKIFALRLGEKECQRI